MGGEKEEWKGSGEPWLGQTAPKKEYVFRVRNLLLTCDPEVSRKAEEGRKRVVEKRVGMGSSQ